MHLATLMAVCQGLSFPLPVDGGYAALKTKQIFLQT